MHAVVLAIAVLGQSSPPPGYTALFNGRDLSGWHGWAIHEKGMGPAELPKLSADERSQKIAEWTRDAQKHWSVQNGELVNDGHGAYLVTDKEFSDYDLLIDYKTVAKADSGIYLKATPQVQIWDSTETAKFNLGADKGSGGLWNNSPGAKGKDPLVLADKPFGEWNSFRIRQLGGRTTVYLNDKLVVDDAAMENFWDRKRPLQPTGPVLLQTHGGEIRWRNIFIREIPAEEANRLLAAGGATASTNPAAQGMVLTPETTMVQVRSGLHRWRWEQRTRLVWQPAAGTPPVLSDGFVSIFNGRDFTGWKGPVENYEVKDGAIVCKPGKGGTIYTAEEYGDFVARVEFKLPPGGNNGLAIRYPGNGDTAYVGMCELQVLDDGHPMYAKLDPRQAHGSAYGIVPAARGYLRPTGQWNYQEVTVKGSTIKVELNGTVILNADLSKVTEYMAKSPHPGKTRTSGHFGFAGHNDPVMFRNVSIKKL